MTRVLAFRPGLRSMPPAADHSPYVMKVRLVNGKRRRRYEIRRIRSGPHRGAVQTAVFLNRKPHRSRLVRNAPRMVAQIHAEYLREIADLVADGWKIV